MSIDFIFSPFFFYAAPKRTRERERRVFFFSFSLFLHSPVPPVGSDIKRNVVCLYRERRERVEQLWFRPVSRLQSISSPPVRLSLSLSLASLHVNWLVLYSVHGRIGSGIHPENEIRVGGGGEGKGLRFFWSREEKTSRRNVPHPPFYIIVSFFFWGGSSLLLTTPT